MYFNQYRLIIVIGGGGIIGFEQFEKNFLMEFNKYFGRITLSIDLT